MDFIGELEKEACNKKLADFKVGDTVGVDYKIREGEKERTQKFIGTVIAIKNRGIRRNFIVRRIVQGEGVERTFPYYSPNVEKIEVRRRGDVRKSKLYYLRDRVGKQTKVKELLAAAGDAATASGGSTQSKPSENPAETQAATAAAETAPSGS